MLSESATQLEFYTLLRRHASEWNRAYNKCITYKRNYQIGIGCLVQAETYNNLADQIDHMTRADFKRWQFYHELEFATLYFHMLDLYGKPAVKPLPVMVGISRSTVPAQLSLF